MHLFEQITLTEEEEKKITQHSSFGKNWVQYHLRMLKAKKYLASTCKAEFKGGSTHTSTYSTGVTIYTRRDGGKIDLDDYAAMSAISNGQVNRFAISEDKSYMTHTWECDSSG